MVFRKFKIKFNKIFNEIMWLEFLNLNLYLHYLVSSILNIKYLFD